MEAISLDNVNTSNLFKIHHFQQQIEPKILQTNHSINLNSNRDIINKKFSNHRILMDSSTQSSTPISSTTTPIILTNFGSINSAQFHQQQNKQSTLLLQIDPNSSGFTTVSNPSIVQTTLHSPQQAFKNLSVYCGTLESNSHQQQLQAQQFQAQQLQVQQQQQQLTIQSKMIEELRYLTNNCNVITSNSPQTMPKEKNVLPTMVDNAVKASNATVSNNIDRSASESSSISQRNLQAILDAICHLEGNHAATAHAAVSAAAAAAAKNTTSSSCSSNDLMVR